MQDCYNSLVCSLDINHESLASLFMIIKLCAYAEKYESRFGLKFKKQAKDFALKIKKLDPYMGYMAWAEIYISQPDKRSLGIQVLEDLIKDNADRP